jgi:membrane-associated phospholipid phosphatase
MMRWKGPSRPILFIIISVIVIGLAATLDRATAEYVRAVGAEKFLHTHKILRESLKTSGFYPFTIVVAFLIAWAHRWDWRRAIFLLIATATAGLNEPIKWIAGRTRPFKTTHGPTDLLTPFQLHPFPGFSSQNLCFPSGHAALAFATAAALGILWPRWRWAFYPLALVVAAERVLENAHWFSDTVAAAALGIGCVWIVRRLLWDNKWGKRTDERDTVSVAGDSGL